MQNRDLASDHVQRASARLLAVDTLFAASSWADVVRESQEVVELALKGLLRACGVVPPRIHDVADVLLAERSRLPKSIHGEVARLADISRGLRRDRELAFYGAEDLTPSDFYKELDAVAARDAARFVVDTVRPLVASRMNLASYYAWLSWFQDGARLVGHNTGQASASSHRLLVSPEGSVSGDVLHERLAAALTTDRTSPTAPVALDAGCGLGGTTFFVAERLGGRCVGITLSPAQQRRATREAARRGQSDTCRFVVRSYDDDLTDLVPDGVDLVVAIESLAHAPDPAGTIERLARLLRPQGRLVIVDDMPTSDLSAADGDVAAFRRGWMCPVVLSGAALSAALSSAGLTIVHDEDLTPLMRRRDPGALARRVRICAAARAVLRHTPARVLMDGLHGGLMLERLYERRVMQYRTLIAARPPGAR